jgi:hypothetical protein
MITMKRIEAEDNFAKLANKYMNSLFDLECAFSPHYYSMREYKAFQVFESDVIRKSEEMTFQLTILSNSLSSVHECILGASGLIQTYLNEYDGDWRHYASVNRVETIKEYGGEDEDFNQDESIRFKDDSESLSSYTIHAELSRFIESKDSQVRGEYVGTSHPADFSELSALVRNKNDFNILSFFRDQGHDIPMYVENQKGEMEQLSTLDRLGKEGYEDILNAELVDIFNLVLLDCKELSEFYQALDRFSDCKDQYTELLERLTRILNMNYKTR